ncbi:MAG: DMT family transporter [Gaiellales bacterium]
MSHQARWRAAVAAIAAGWGSVAVIVKAVDLPAAAIAFYRVALAALALAAGAAALRRLDLLSMRGRRWPLMRLGMLLAVHWLAYFETIKLSSVALGVLLTYTGPLFVAVLAPTLLGTPTPRRMWGTLGAGALGVALVATEGGGALHATGTALATGMVAGFTFGLLIVAGRSLAPHVTAPAFAFWETATASVVLLPVALGGRLLPPGPAAVAGLLALGVGATAVLVMLFAHTLRHVDAQSVGVLLYVEPVSSVTLAWLLLSEQPSMRTVLGGGLVLAAGMVTVGLAPPPATLAA